MTTTLRPSGPEQRFPDGTRARTYDICVNSRPVGGVRLRTEPEPGRPAGAAARTGRMDRLTVAPADRRCGRATVAALAAEEVLRGWGCARVRLAVPATAEPALNLAAALGYREVGSHLAKRLVPTDGPPELPPGSSARPLEESEAAGWRAASRARFVEDCVANGLDREFAEARARADHDELLPEGAATADACLRVLEHDGRAVGTLWLSLARPRTEGGYVYSVAVEEACRGRGHGRTLMLLAERESLAAGADRLALNVFASNAVARRLYDSLGYEATVVHLNKPLR